MHPEMYMQGFCCFVFWSVFGDKRLPLKWIENEELVDKMKSGWCYTILGQTDFLKANFSF